VEVEPVRVDELTGKRFTFFADPDGLPLELYEAAQVRLPAVIWVIGLTMKRPWEQAAFFMGLERDHAVVSRATATAITIMPSQPTGLRRSPNSSRPPRAVPDADGACGGRLACHGRQDLAGTDRLAEQSEGTEHQQNAEDAPPLVAKTDGAVDRHVGADIQQGGAQY
jgi:hypothetical protein